MIVQDVQPERQTKSDPDALHQCTYSIFNEIYRLRELAGEVVNLEPHNSAELPAQFGWIAASAIVSGEEFLKHEYKNGLPDLKICAVTSQAAAHAVHALEALQRGETHVFAKEDKERGDSWMKGNRLHMVIKLPDDPSALIEDAKKIDALYARVQKKLDRVATEDYCGTYRYMQRLTSSDMA